MARGAGLQPIGLTSGATACPPTITGVALGSSSWAVRQSGSSRKQKRQVRSAGGVGAAGAAGRWAGGRRRDTLAGTHVDLPCDCWPQLLPAHSPSSFPACCSCQRLRQDLWT